MAMRAAWVLAAAMVVGCGAAEAQTVAHRTAGWDAVEGLAVGSAVDVQGDGQAGIDRCVLLQVDEMALTCVGLRGARLVFPRSAVQSVWVFGEVRERHIVKWVLIGAGVGLGVALCVANPLGCLIVGAVAIGVVETHPPGPPMPPVRRARMRRRLVYAAPVP
jgi:hypothetical protein